MIFDVEALLSFGGARPLASDSALFNTRLIFLLDRPLLFLQSYMILFGLSAPRGNLVVVTPSPRELLSAGWPHRLGNGRGPWCMTTIGRLRGAQFRPSELGQSRIFDDRRRYIVSTENENVYSAK